MVCTFNKAAPPGYYIQALSYYSENEAGVWFSPHGGLAVLDGSDVTPHDFECLYSGQSLTGAMLGNSGGHTFDRVAAFDFTFSASKSASILWSCAPAALATRLKHEHLSAVRDGLQAHGR